MEEEYPVDEPYDYCSNHALESVESTAAPQLQSPPPSIMPQFAFTGDKAGMENVDRDRVNRIIEQASQGNPYYEKAKRDEENTRERARELKRKALALTPKDFSVAMHVVNKRVLELEQYSTLHQVYVMIDMDQFYVAVEMRDNEALRDKPVAAGKGLISTANYCARKFGVRSAMPEFIARKLCPQLICVNLRFNAYKEAASRAREVFAQYDSNFKSYGLDEARLDLTKHERLRGLNLTTREGVDACEELVSEIRIKVFEATNGLTCSAGVACTSKLAKICSERNKPNGQFILHAETRQTLLEFIHALPVRKIPGIGKSSEILLQAAFDVTLVRDLWEQRFVLNRLLTPCLSDFYLRVALAVPSSSPQTAEEEDKESSALGRKSISRETTFRATSNEDQLKQILSEVCEQLAQDISRKDLYGYTVTLKLKSDMFEIKSRGETFKQMIGGSGLHGEALYKLVEPMLNVELPFCARLIGVRLSSLVEPSTTTTTTPTTTTGAVGSQSLDRYYSFTSSQDERCPVCSAPLETMSNDRINAHLDSCLNSSVMSELIAETKRVKTLDEYFK